MDDLPDTPDDAVRDRVPAGGPAGRVTRLPDGRAELVFRREFPDAVEDVWAAVTEPERCARWFASWSGDARVGGTVSIVMTSDEDGGGPPETARITACDAPTRLALSIGDSDAGTPWEVAVDLSATAAGGTVLVFRQVLPEGLSPADAGPGWHWYLDRLGAVLSGGPMPDWETTLAGTRPHYAI